MSKINYLVGDVCNPVRTPTVITHCVNDIGIAGSGVVMAIRNKWPHTIEAYEKWANKDVTVAYNAGYEASRHATLTKIPLGNRDFVLGAIQVVKAEKGIAVCNLVGQRSVGNFHDIPPIRYEAIHEGLYRLSLWMIQAQEKMESPIVMSCPRFGAARAGGKWEKIEQIIMDTICAAGFEVDVYDPDTTVQSHFI